MDNEQIFRSAMAEVFGQGRLDAVEKYFSPDFQEHEEGPGKGKGREGLKDIVRMVRTAFPDLAVEVEAIRQIGDETWARVQFSGTNTGELMGHAPTERRATWVALDQCRYADGKLVEHWGAVDMLAMLNQVGLLPSE